jgi:hypothetical protein
VKIFLGRGGLVFLPGVFAKTGGKTWCFGGGLCGEDGGLAAITLAAKDAPRILDLFFAGFPFWESGQVLPERKAVSLAKVI